MVPNLNCPTEHPALSTNWLLNQRVKQQLLLPVLKGLLLKTKALWFTPYNFLLVYWFFRVYKSGSTLRAAYFKTSFTFLSTL